MLLVCHMEINGKDMGFPCKSPKINNNHPAADDSCRYPPIPIVASVNQNPDPIPIETEDDRVIPSRPRSRSEVNIVCEICHTCLTGVHATGNLARHQKSLKCASSSKRKEWRCSQCDKVYQRSDGLRKHTRGKHGTSGSGARNVSGEEA